MIIKTSGCSALILATGLFVCFAGPSQAAGATDATASSKSDTAAGAPIALNKYAKHAAHHSKKLAQGKSSNVALKSSTDKDKKAAAADEGDSSTVQPSDIPPAVANANAQLASADTPTDAAKAMSARASNIVQAAPDSPANPPPAADATQDNSQVVSADQLNDVDRSLHQNSAPTKTLAMASADAPPRALAASNESTTWDQTSLIGKIFIGFGALLTMASAARMFIA
jgi:hypothetical protein